MFHGCITALVTPFKDDLSIDFDRLTETIEEQIAEGIDAIVLCGTTGESCTLSEEEQIAIFKVGVEAAKGRIPIIAGTGLNDTRATVAMTERAKACKVDACFVVVPYYNRPTFEGCLFHYREVAKVGLPTILYHHPGRTGVKLSAKNIAKICEISEIVAVKETSFDVHFAMELMQLTDKPIFTGDDVLSLPTICSGGAGVFSVLSNLIPGEWAQMVHSLQKGQWEEGKELFHRYWPLCQALFREPNPQGIKYALAKLGKGTGRLRPPLFEIGLEFKKQIDNELEVFSSWKVKN